MEAGARAQQAEAAAVKFVAVGTYVGFPVRVEWQDGAIVSADPDELLVEVKAMIRAEVEVTLPPYAPGRATLDDPWLAMATLDEVLDDFEVIEAERLPDDSLPPGAVGAAVGHYEPPERP